MENELDGNVALASGILSNSDDSDVEDKYELPEGEGGKQNKKKRTAPGDSSSSSDEIDEAERIAKIKAKKKARRKKEKEHKKRKLAEIVVKEVRFQPVEDQRSYFWKNQQLSAGGKGTKIEANDEIIPEEVFLFPPNRVGQEWTTDDISAIMKDIDSTLVAPIDAQKEKPGRPRFLVLCRAALRAIEVMKAVTKDLPKHVRVANLFAKHKKVEEQTDYLKKTVTRIAIGTPNRIQKLVEDGSLNLEGLEYIVIDMGKDVKTMTILDLKPTRDEFFALYHACLKSRVMSHNSKIVMV